MFRFIEMGAKGNITIGPYQQQLAAVDFAVVFDEFSPGIGNHVSISQTVEIPARHDHAADYMAVLSGDVPVQCDRLLIRRTGFFNNYKA